jgi:hypothetical protein
MTPRISLQTIQCGSKLLAPHAHRSAARPSCRPCSTQIRGASWATNHSANRRSSSPTLRFYSGQRFHSGRPMHEANLQKAVDLVHRLQQDRLISVNNFTVTLDTGRASDLGVAQYPRAPMEFAVFQLIACRSAIGSLSVTHRTISHFSFCRISGNPVVRIEASLARVSNARLENAKIRPLRSVNMYWSNGHGTG